MNAFVPCHSSTPKSLSKSSVMVYHGICHPIRAFTRSMSACGAREQNTRVQLLARSLPLFWGHDRGCLHCEMPFPVFHGSLLVLVVLAAEPGHNQRGYAAR